MQNRKFFVALLAIIVLFLGVFTFAQTTGNNEEEKIIDENETIKKEIPLDEEKEEEPIEEELGDENQIIPSRTQTYVDVTAPIITISNYITTPTNQDIVVTATTNEGTLNRTSYTFTDNGSFTFVAIDAAGNSSEKEVVITNIDKTAPVITIGEYITTPTNQDIVVTATTNEGTLNRTSYTFTDNGSFTFVAIDAAGNSSEKEVVITNIDKTAPVITTGDYVTTPTNQDVVVSATTNEGTLNQTSYTFTDNGSFVFIATDAAGNSSEKEVVITNIDKTAPVITIGDYVTTPTNQDVVVSATTNEGTLNQTSYTFTENGSFDFIATDAAGNVTTKTVTVDNIDKIIPKFDLNSGYHTTGDIVINVTETNLKSINVYNQDAKTNTLVVNGEILTSEATYKITATDTAGNKTDLWVAIDRTNPTITGFDNNKYYNTDVEVTVYDKFLTSVTLNSINQTPIKVIGANNEGKELKVIVSEKGTYTVVGTDKVGNKTTMSFTIDKTAPEAPTLTSPLNNSIIKGDIITNSWSAVSDAVKYLYESYRNETATISRHKQTVNASSHSKTATNIAEDTFWWRVKSVDQAGNESLWSDLWKVTVDNTKPIITLNGDAIVYVEFGTGYEELGVKVTDNVDEDLEAIITSDLDLTKLGTYTIKYNVTDTAGNIADGVTRTVVVRDTTKPVINLNGGDMEIVLGESFTDPGVASVSDNYAVLTLENVNKTGSVNVNVEGTYELNYSITDGFNPTNIKRKVIVKPLIKQLSVYNPNEETKYNGFNISFNRDFVVNDPSQIKIQYEYSIEGGSYVLANLVKYPGYVSSNPTYLQEEEKFKSKTTTFYGMLNANGGKILYKKSWIVIESFQADTISKDVVVSMQEHNVQDRLRTAYKAIQSGKTVSIRTILTFKLENGEKVTYKLDPIEYN